MKAEILTIGDEILRGEIVDSNKAFLSEQLRDHEIECRYQTSVCDDPADMTDAFRRAVARADVVLVSGGLGPTRDDVTVEVLAATFDRKLVLDEASLEGLRVFFKRVGREMGENNASQAWFPSGSDVIPNPIGTAPGCALDLSAEETGNQRAIVLCMPGVPRELRLMMQEQVLPRIASWSVSSSSEGSSASASDADKDAAPARFVRAKLLRTFGLGESTLDEQLRDLAMKPGDELGFRTSFPDNALRPVARAASAEEAEQRVEAMAAEIRRRLGDIVYSEGDETMESVVGALLIEHGKTLAVAESCTGGLIAEKLTRVPGSSAYFAGGVVAYSDAAKVSMLGVPEALLEEHGAVSNPVAEAMAEGARERFGTSFGIATTGISGPGGGTDEKPVGLVSIAISIALSKVASESSRATIHSESFVFPLDRERHRGISAQVALDWVRRSLLGVELVGPSLLRQRGGGQAASGRK